MLDLRLRRLLPDEPHGAAINHIAFSGSGKIMATSDVSMRVNIWHAGILLRSIDLTPKTYSAKRMARGIRSIALDQEGEALLYAADELIGCHDLPTDRSMWRIQSPTIWGFLRVYPLSLSRLRSGALVVAYDNALMEMRAANGALVDQRKGNWAPTMVAPLSDSDHIIGSDGNFLHVWSTRSRSPVVKLKSKGRIYALAAHPEEECVAVRYADHVAILHPFSGYEEASLPVLPGLPRMQFSAFGRRLLMSDRKGVMLYDLNSRIAERREISESPVVSCALAPDATYAVAGLQDGTMHVWPLSEPG